MSILTPDEMEGMRDCAWVLREIVQDLGTAVAPGATTAEIDRIAGGLVESYGVRSAFRGYRGYPAFITASVNEEVIDGVPGERALADGDLLKLQIGIESEGYYAYWADTYPIGASVAEEARRLLSHARQALGAAMARCTPDRPVEEVSRAIQETLEQGGYEAIRQYCGHGIGKRMHEEPQVPCYVDLRGLGRYRLSEREVLALQVLALSRPARLTSKGGLTMVAPKGVHSVHVGSIVAVGAPPAALLGAAPPAAG